MKQLEIYGREINGRECPFCTSAKSLATACKLPFVYHDCTNDEARFEELKARFPEVKTVPQIFVGDVRIGGFDDFRKAIASGRIHTLLGE